MSTEFSEKALQEADAAIKATQAYQASTAEKRLNALGTNVFPSVLIEPHSSRNVGDAVSNVAHSRMVSIAQGDIAQEAFSFVKDQVSAFTQHSKVLMKVLDEVGKAHPFIQGNVALSHCSLSAHDPDQIVRSCGVSLQSWAHTRAREAQQRRQSPRAQCDHVRYDADPYHVRLALLSPETDSKLRYSHDRLKQVADPKAPGPGGLSIEDRLRQRMGAIIDTIKRCAKVCDSYQKRSTAGTSSPPLPPRYICRQGRLPASHLFRAAWAAVKFFTSTKWQGKFTEVAQKFADHKTGIQFDLQIHASVGITSANLTLSTMSVEFTQLNANVSKLMEVVFERFRSPEERDLSSLVAAQPGGAEAVLKDDQLLQQVLAKQNTRTGGASAKEDKASKKHPVGQGDAVQTVSELKKEISKDVDQVLAENKFFDQKFDAMRLQVDEVKVTIKHESDRVIDAVLSGPHERIVDRVSSHFAFIELQVISDAKDDRICTTCGKRWSVPTRG